MEPAVLRAPAATHVLATLAVGAAAVVIPAQLGLILLIARVALVVRRVKRRAREVGRLAGAADLAVHLALMAAIVLAAGLAPVKTIDRVKARRITLTKPAWTVGELKDPVGHDLIRPFYGSVNAPDDLDGRVVRFPSAEPTIAELIRAIESQTPLRHRFAHCGNGSSILWGGDCSFGVNFRVPSP